MIGRGTYVALSWAMIALAAVTAIALRFVVAPYGRHARGGWGPTIPERWGWMIMESPSLVIVTVLFFRGHDRSPAVAALWAMWAAHYAQRTLVYPFRIRGHKRMPIAIAVLAIAFNVLNATINGSWLGSLASRDAAWLRDPRFVLGALLFAAGMAINVDSDRRLFALRKRGEGGYAIPRGGLFELVASPNYLGEIVEWSGWALASFSLGGLAFALYTIANLAPRAASHLAWYRATFPDFPRNRRALVPFVW